MPASAILRKFCVRYIFIISIFLLPRCEFVRDNTLFYRVQDLIPGLRASYMLDVGPHKLGLQDTRGAGGFWFTSPTDMLITGLRSLCPTLGKKSYEVLLLDAPPDRAWRSARKVLFYKTGVKRSSWIDVNIEIKKDQIIGIVGSVEKDDLSTWSRGEGTGRDYQTSILGQEISIHGLHVGPHRPIVDAPTEYRQAYFWFGRVGVRFSPPRPEPPSNVTFSDSAQ